MSIEGKFASMSLAQKKDDDFTFDKYAPKQHGSSGKPAQLLANYFRMSVRGIIVYHYNIEIVPVDKSAAAGDAQKKIVKRKKIPKEVNFLVFDKLWRQERVIFPSEPVFDGEKNFYLANQQLNLSSYEARYVVTIQENGRDSSFSARITTPDDSHRIDLRAVNDISVSDFKSTEIQAIDIILKNGPRRVKVAIGFNLFLRTLDLKKLPERHASSISTYLGDNKELRFGFYQSARMTEGGLMLNVDRASIVFNKGGPLLQIIYRILDENRRDRFGEQEKKMIESEIKGLKINVNHIAYRPKFTIYKLTPQSISQITFEEEKDGRKRRTSVLDYFNDTYKDFLRKENIRLDRNLPCVQVGRDKPKYFPIEVCELIEDQHFTKKLKGKQQADMTRFGGQQNPRQRFDEINRNLEAIIRDNQKDGRDTLRDFGIQIDSDFVKVEGRVLEPPKLMYQKEYFPGYNGAWDMGRDKLTYKTPADLEDKWMIVNIGMNRGSRFFSGCRKDSLDKFQQGFIQKARELGMRIAAPKGAIYDYNYTGKGSMRKFFEDISGRYKDLKLILFFIPKMEEIYHELKTVAECEMGIATQCIAQENEKKFTSFQYVANVLLKVNAKLAGVNVIWHPSSTPDILKKCTMIMGLDVTHPAPADKLSQSIAACVASYDRNFSKYFARVVVQPKPKKEIVDLARMTVELLKEFEKKNKRLPDQLIIFRDGVSEGQFDEVMSKELALLKNAFRTLNIDPKVMFLVVQKRNHTRFLNLRPPQGARNENVVPGTVVDNKITSNILFDYYIVAHQGMIGTSRPCHFYVLYDELKASADDIEKMTYYLCYLYPRCNRSISTPPPVMYAHLSAKRARSHMFIQEEQERGSAKQSSGSGEQYRQLSEQETEALNKKLMVKKQLNGILYYV